MPAGSLACRYRSKGFWPAAGRAVLAAAIGVSLPGCAVLSAHSANEPLPNFHQVNPRLYRGGQPTDAGIRQLAARGVKTVVCLREENQRVFEAEKRLSESLGMRWVHLPMRSYWKPADGQVRDFLAMAATGSDGPVFVHCRRGRDRSGVMVAIYHVVIDGWEPHEAYKDALAHGMIRWNPWFRHLIFSAQRRYGGPSARRQAQQNASTDDGGG